MSLNPFLLLTITLSILQIKSTIGISVVKDETTYYDADFCETHVDCFGCCGYNSSITAMRWPRCDYKGICVCDCSNMDIVNSNPIPEPCKTHIPSKDQDACIKYSGDTYNRQQARMCGVPGTYYVYCTSLCKWY